MGKYYGHLNGKSNGLKQSNIPKLKNRKYPHLIYDKTLKRLRSIYNNMLKRCYYKKSIGYKNWGGRGIIVCNEWLDDFLNFYNWAIVNGYQSNLSIDRINNDGNYEPLNCRWATAKQQRHNQRTYNVL